MGKGPVRINPRKRSVYISQTISEAVADSSGDPLIPVIGGVDLSKRLAVVAARYTEIGRRYLPKLTDPEWRIVLAALRSTATTAGREFVHDDASRLVSEIEDYLSMPGCTAFDDESLDVEALVEKFASMSYAEAVAVVDRVERWWSLTKRYPGIDVPLAAAGIDAPWFDDAGAPPPG